MDAWDPVAVRNSFAFAAEDAERYFKELAVRIKHDKRQDSSFVRETHDKHLAEWFVHDSFAFSNSLNSREELVAEAKRRLAAGFGGHASGCFSKEDFDKHWNQQMQILISQYETA